MKNDTTPETDKASLRNRASSYLGVVLRWLVSHLVLRRFTCWATRDAEMNEKWWRALEAEDYEECERLRYAMRRNWQGYRQDG